MTRIVIGLAALVLLAAAVGCGMSSTPAAGGDGRTEAMKLHVMVPCGQVGPVSEIVKLFEAENPDIKVDWVPENIVTITTKIIDGVAHPDVFLSMGDLELDLVAQEGLVLEGTRTAYAENSLAIMVPTGNPAGVETLADLVKADVKTITIPDPETNSVGKHAVEALQEAGIWEQVQGKLLYARFAADSKDAAAKGQAQASIGYYPCAVEVHVAGEEPAQPKNLKLLCQIPADAYPSFKCEGAVLKDAQNPEAGKKLLAFMERPESQEIFQKWQFIGDVKASPTE
jgi:molybdate transport system substrate-binding protein